MSSTQPKRAAGSVRRSRLLDIRCPDDGTSVGTCAMDRGRDSLIVVGEDFRMHGLDNLLSRRCVCDAGNPGRDYEPAINMLAELAAERIAG